MFAIYIKLFNPISLHEVVYCFKTILNTLLHIIYINRDTMSYSEAKNKTKGIRNGLRNESKKTWNKSK